MATVVYQQRKTTLRRINEVIDNICNMFMICSLLILGTLTLALILINI